MSADQSLDGLERAIVERGASQAEPARPRLVPTPLLSAVEEAGTEHIYADTADVRELGALLDAGEDAVRREVDGNTANQPLVSKVLERVLDAGDPGAWARDLLANQGMLPRERILPLLYAIVCARIGDEICKAFASGRAWEVSLQLHMGLCPHPEAARWMGELLRRAVPSAIVKVPFTPDAPHCFLVARDLEHMGIPVNFTSTFSARQAVAAALLADVSRTNIFMGRLNQGLQAELLGEHVDLEAQRSLRVLREERGVKTRLIVASIHDWRTFVRAAGCDVFTSPCKVLGEFLEQEETPPEEVRCQLGTSYEDALGISDEVLGRLGRERIARLYRVEPELVEFLLGLRQAHEYSSMSDGEALYKRFDQAGFADLFHFPTATEQREMERGKLPELDGTLIERVPIDTHYSLLANADFSRTQRQMDAEIEKRLDAGKSAP